MPFQAEIETLVRQEAQRGRSSCPIYLWPTILGENQLVDAAATADYFDPSGTLLGSLAVTDAGDIPDPPAGTVSRLHVLVDASSLELGEGYRVEFAYDPPDGILGSTITEAVPFDVVVEAFGTLDVGYSDIVAEWAAAGEKLDRQAAAQGGSRNAEQQAAILAHLSWADVRRDLKKRIEANGGSWPAYLADKDLLRPVVVAGAIEKLVVAGGLSSPTQQDLAEWWRLERERRLDALPELRISTDDDREPDDTLGDWSVVPISR